MSFALKIKRRGDGADTPDDDGTTADDGLGDDDTGRGN